MSSPILKSRQGFTGQIVRSDHKDARGAHPALPLNKQPHSLDSLDNGAAMAHIQAEAFPLPDER